MHAQHTPVDDGRQGQVVKNVSAIAPCICIAILALALVVKTIHLGDLPALMVATQQCDMGWVARLEQQEQCKHLEGVVPTIHKITHKDVVGIWDVPASIKELHEVVKLAMDVATHSHRAVDRLHIGFLYKYLFDICTQGLEFVLCKILAALGRLNPLVQIHCHCYC